jgi:hypothetical protein
MPFQAILYFGYGISRVSGTKQAFYIEKSIPKFVTALSVPINHEHRDSTPYLFNDAFASCDYIKLLTNNEQESIRKAVVIRHLQFDAMYWPLPEVTQVS